MDFSKVDLAEYAALRRPRFYVDEDTDSEWYFGTKTVEAELLRRIRTDVDVRGVPKCGIVGRFGIGKTHTLNHLKWGMSVEDPPELSKMRAFRLDLAWDESNANMNSWRSVHGRMLDAVGEPFIREIVRAIDSMNTDGNLQSIIYEHSPFGDENLKSSLAEVLAEYFKRDMKRTYEAWQWLKADKGLKRPDQLGIKKLLTDVDDMVYVIMNLGALAQYGLGRAIVFLFDEAQDLANVVKAKNEVHRAFLRLADQENKSVGFVLAIFGSGLNRLPPVLTQPEDVLSRLGANAANMNEAFIELHKVMSAKSDVDRFITDLLEKLVDHDQAAKIIADYSPPDVTSITFPFTQSALVTLRDALCQKEDTKNPRTTIDRMATCVSLSYHASKEAQTFVPVTDAIARQAITNL